jgi:serine/threonine-protein kinase
VSVLAARYALIDRIGEGAAGVVWLAHDQKLERDVAIKVLRPAVASDREQRQRFAREARLLAQLSNEHIVRVFDYVDDGERAFLVMEHIEGVDLARATAATRPLRIDQAAAYAAPVARALAYAHGKGVVHRDLTPANVLIERWSGRVVTTDFGLARLARSSSTLTATGTLIGTPEYWSPEQAQGRASDVATDVYALGCILFLLLADRLPFEGEDRLAVGLRRAHEAAPSLRERLPRAPEEAVELVDSMLAHDPADRPSARTASAALEKLARGAAVPATGWSGRRVDPATLLVSTEQATVVASRTTAGTRRRWRPAFVALLAAAATAAGVFALVDALTASAQHAPRLVGLRETAARVRVHHSLPDTPVRVVRAYSLRVATGRVMRQAPPAGGSVAGDAPIRIVVSKGTPFAAVPAVSAGTQLDAARAALAGAGFLTRYRYTPSWSVRKGSVIEVQPRSGTRLRRPARVKIVIASGYPRAVVPNVENADLAAAQSTLAAKHLRYRIVYRLEHDARPNQVLGQIPAPGATVYSGTRVRLTVSRTTRWERVVAQTGVGRYESEPFTVPERWRIRYRLTAGSFGAAVAQVGWSAEGGFLDGGAFLAREADRLQTHVVSDGAGTFRLVVNPYLGTGWYVEVDAFR